MRFHPARREDARLSGYGGLGEGGGVAGARSPDSMGAGSRARGVRMRAGGRPGGAGLRGEGAAAVVAVSLASWRGRCVVARAVVGKAPGVACVGPARPREPALAGSSPHLRPEPGTRAAREAGLCPCRPGDEGRAEPVLPREAPRGRASLPRPPAFLLHGPGSEGTRLQGRGEARVWRNPRGERCSAAVEPRGRFWFPEAGVESRRSLDLFLGLGRWKISELVR